MSGRRGRPPIAIMASDKEPGGDRGRLMTAKEVAKEKFGGKISDAWVRRTAPGKITLGRSTVFFYERDIDYWIESCREEGSS